jgi:RNA polymerase sigma factor (sigma-70 family)
MPKSNGRSPLTEAQRDLAERYLPLARSLAKPLKRAWPEACDEFESAACLALVEAAEAYESGRGVRFATFARHRIRGALRDAQRKMIVLGWRADMAHAPQVHGLRYNSEGQGRILGAEPDPPIGTELEMAEEVEGWLKKLPAKHAAACRELYLNERTQMEAADAIGCSQSRLSYMHREALAMLDGSWYSRAGADFIA